MVTDPFYQIISFAVCGLIKANSAIADDSVVSYILREKSLAIYFENSQFIRITTLNFIVSKIYVDKRSRVR